MRWFQGKKTYIAAGGLALLALFGYWSGALSDANALILLLLAGQSVGIRAAMTRHKDEILGAMRAGKKAAPKPPKRLADAAEKVEPLADAAVAKSE